MSSLKDQLTDANVSEMHRVVVNGKQNFLCFTKTSSSSHSWMICVTDGIDVWKLDLDDEDLETHRELADINKMDTYLAKIRKGFVDGDLTVTMIGNKITLNIGKSAGVVTFDLYEAKAAEKKVELQGVLFRLAESSTKLESDLATANKTIDTLKAQKGGGGNASVFMDLGPKKVNNPATVKPKKTGMSVVNPTSRKRKAATGVVFE